jgi:hypothetical protein
MTTEEERYKELVRLLEEDAERTSKFVESIVGTGFTIRGWAITVSLAIVGIAFDRDLWELAILGLVIVLLFAFMDGYHTWLYTQALKHGRAIDHILGLHYATLTRGVDDPSVKEEFQVEVEVHKFGLSSNLERFRWASLRRVRPRFIMGVMYIILGFVAIVAAIAIAVTGPKHESKKLECTRAGHDYRTFDCIEK